MDWNKFIKTEKGKEYFKKLDEFLTEERKTNTVYPLQVDLFKAFELTPYDDVKVVILGQDPYHREGQANGLAFSVNPGIQIPRSLMNIYKELQTEYDLPIPSHGDLSGWAKQGVFLLNTYLTVVEGTPEAHKNIGWNIFTDSAIKEINKKSTPVVFMLWGEKAQSKIPLIDSSKHKILTATHPSPFSARKGFFGCNHFIECNKFLVSTGQSPIDWHV